MATNKITFWELLQNNSIEIPIVQRDYAQGRVGKEYLRKNFLTSLKQALDGEILKLDFVYGSVENNIFQPLDGQQRLTTLWLLHWYIALFADKYEEAFSILSKFSYETRISSREFIQTLCNPENFTSFDKKNVVKFIKDATWYYSAWNQDPTISSMLRMIKGTNIEDKGREGIIDGLEELFSNTEKDVFEKYWKRLTETDAIAFYQQPLEDFGLSDDLYVKMNARGKELTSFENLKADLIGYLREQERDSKQDEILNKRWKKLLDIRSGIPIKIDTKWNQIFWKNRSDDYKIDEIFFVYVNRFFWNELFTAKDDKGNYILTLSSTLKNPSYEYFNSEDSDKLNKYTGFDPYKYYEGSIPVSFFEKLERILDHYSSFQGTIPTPRWMKGFDFIPTYRNNKNSKDNKKEISGINQLQRIVFFAVCKYFSKEVPNQQSLNRWMRVVYNLISGVDRTGISEIRDVETVRKAISYLDTIDSHNAISSLASKKMDDAKGELTRRWNEEIAKAVQIDNNPDWENRIIEAEDYSFFHGSIRFLFQDKEGNTDWAMFDEKWNTVQRFFVKDEPKDENQNSVMNNGYDNAELLKTLFSRFTTDNFKGNLWWYYRTFNNKANTWRYYLLSPDLCSPIHYLLLEYPRSTQWQQSCQDDFAKHTLFLLTHTQLLDYVIKEKSNSWIRDYWNHNAIYPSSTGIFLDTFLRDEFLLNSDGIQINDSVKITGTPLLYGWDINFRYKQHNFQWYRRDCVYLMDSNNANMYVIKNAEGREPEEKYFCFYIYGMSKEDILSRLDKLIEEKRSSTSRQGENDRKS